MKSTTIKDQASNKSPFLVMVVIILTFFGQHVYAADSQTFYLDNLNTEDTIMYCLGNESIVLVAPEFGVNITWIFNA